MEKETLEAKLRNQLTPIYSIVQMILLMDEKPELKDLVVRQARQCVANKSKIDALLVEIESKTLNKHDVIESVYCYCETPRKSAADNSMCKRCKKKLRQ